VGRTLHLVSGDRLFRDCLDEMLASSAGLRVVGTSDGPDDAAQLRGAAAGDLLRVERLLGAAAATAAVAWKKASRARLGAAGHGGGQRLH